MPDQQAELIAAAHAAANWARMRRATWTDAPLPVLPVTTDFAPAVTSQPAVAAPARPAGPSAVARAASRIGTLAGPAVRQLPRAAAMIAMVAAGGAAVYYGGRYLLKQIADYRAQPTTTVERPAAIPEPAPTAKPKNTGTVEVDSTPPGAQVWVDGKGRGVTPFTQEVSVGRHTIELRSPSGNVQRTITVQAGKTVRVEESIFSGFLALYSPFEVVITEGDRTLRVDERNQVMMSPGRHEIRVTNRALDYESVYPVDIKSGETARVTVNAPPTPVTVTANEAAEVWLDGAKIGDVPVNEMPVALGTHEVVVKRAAGGERRQTITVTTKPITLNIDFSK